MADHEVNELQEHGPPEANRRDLLKKICAALAAASAAPLLMAQTKPGATGNPMSAVTMAPTPGSHVKLDPSIRLPLPSAGEYDVFYARPPGASEASLVVLRRSDAQAVQRVAKQVSGPPPFTARLVNGVVHIDLGARAAGRCILRDVFL